MVEIRVVRSVSMGHRLPDYKGLCSSIHGHNLKAEVSVFVPNGEFLDYKVADKILADALEPFDHAMIFALRDPALPLFLDFVDACDQRGINLCQRLVILSDTPTTEVVAQYLFGLLTEQGLNVSEVRLYETEKYSSAAVSMSGVRRCDVREVLR